jgi:hypothetical protein
MIADTPGANRMQLASGDHHPLQGKRAGESKFHLLIVFIMLYVNEEKAPFLLRRIS